MARTDRSDDVQRYLHRLDAALVGVPARTAEEIRAGITEELTSLDGDAARVRIAQLGDPEFIAAEARGETRDDGTPRKSGTESRAYVIVASIAVAVGIYVVPIIGAVVGFPMVWFSRAWRRWEKVVATCIPIVAGVITAIYFVLMAIYSTDGAGSVLPGFGSAPLDDSSTNGLALFFTPLVTVNALFAVALGNLGAGIWLLIRAMRRT